MGLDVYGKIIVGEKFVKKIIVQEKIKYNPDTGNPHKTEEKMVTWALEGNEDVLLDARMEIRSLETFGNENGEFKLIGIEVSKTSLRGDVHCVEINFETQISTAISFYLNLVKRTPKVWNFLRISS